MESSFATYPEVPRLLTFLAQDMGSQGRRVAGGQSSKTSHYQIGLCTSIELGQGHGGPGLCLLAIMLPRA
jgi:hypothetical protein